jgi:hypothetical protein
MRTKLLVLSGFVLSGALAAACMSMTVGDESMYLTGTEEYAITLANGQPGCTNPKKVLICHIPPGNPANQHDICVSTNAVEPHQTHHGDFVGACNPTPPPPPPDVDAGEPPPPEPDAPPPPPPGDDGGVIP